MISILIFRQVSKGGCRWSSSSSTIHPYWGLEPV